MASQEHMIMPGEDALNDKEKLHSFVTTMLLMMYSDIKLMYRNSISLATLVKLFSSNGYSDEDVIHFITLLHEVSDDEGKAQIVEQLQSSADDISRRCSEEIERE